MVFPFVCDDVAILILPGPHTLSCPASMCPQRVLLVDDLIATGGTLNAGIRLVSEWGAGRACWMGKSERERKKG